MPPSNQAVPAAQECPDLPQVMLHWKEQFLLPQDLEIPVVPWQWMEPAFLEGVLWSLQGIGLSLDKRRQRNY